MKIVPFYQLDRWESKQVACEMIPLLDLAEQGASRCASWAHLPSRQRFNQKIAGIGRHFSPSNLTAEGTYNQPFSEEILRDLLDVLYHLLRELDHQSTIEYWSGLASGHLTAEDLVAMRKRSAERLTELMDRLLGRTEDLSEGLEDD